MSNNISEFAPFKHVSQNNVSKFAPFKHVSQNNASTFARFELVSQNNVSKFAPFKHVSQNNVSEFAPFKHVSQNNVSEFAPSSSQYVKFPPFKGLSFLKGTLEQHIFLWNNISRDPDAGHWLSVVPRHYSLPFWFYHLSIATLYSSWLLSECELFDLVLIEALEIVVVHQKFSIHQAGALNSKSNWHRPLQKLMSLIMLRDIREPRSL